jgi:hypothetical protein
MMWCGVEGEGVGAGNNGLPSTQCRVGSIQYAHFIIKPREGIKGQRKSSKWFELSFSSLPRVWRRFGR